MRILILGNMANDGYSAAKGLRKKNVEVDLAINSSENIMALPQWEESEMEGKKDPYSSEKKEIQKAWNAPDWIRYFDFKNDSSNIHIFEKIKTRFDLLKIIREYDIVETHVPYSIYAQFSGTPYVPYDAGWVRYFPFGNGLRDKLARRSYIKAKKIMFTNPDTLEIFDNLKYLDKEKIHFVPFAIDPEKYKPIDTQKIRIKYAKNNELVLFSPARQNWKHKGNDKMIKAFAKFVKEFPNSKLILVSWHIDKEKSKSLVKELGISDKVIWINPVPKNQLIQYYNAADIVLDQFMVGSWGTSTPEAMSCGKPVLIYLKENYIIRAFGEMPPLLNSFSIEDIYCNLKKLDNEEFRKELGKRCREWVIKTHSPEKVASKHLEILKSVLG